MKIIESDKVIYAFKAKMNYIEKIGLGEEFIVKTNDCFYQQIKTEDDLVEEIDGDKLNPATGPLYIEGAESGDILKVEILDIEVASEGVALTIPQGGALGDLVSEPVTKTIPIKDNRAYFNDHINFPIKPMIGVIGVATSEQNGIIPTSTPHKHGGNMDTKEITKGSILYLPVEQDGALLALGDLHGVMGDGELCFTGLEIPGQVKLKVDLIKNKKIEWPILETQEDIMVIASERSMDSALHSSASTLVAYISKAKNISFEEAYILASLNMDIRISQVVNPLVTLRAAIPKDIIDIEEIIGILE